MTTSVVTRSLRCLSWQHSPIGLLSSVSCTMCSGPICPSTRGFIRISFCSSRSRTPTFAFPKGASDIVSHKCRKFTLSLMMYCIALGSYLPVFCFYLRSMYVFHVAMQKQFLLKVGLLSTVCNMFSVLYFVTYFVSCHV